MKYNKQKPSQPTTPKTQVIDFCITYVKRSFSARYAGAELWRDIKDATKFKNVRVF